MQTIVETALFVKQAAALVRDDHVNDLIDFLSAQSQAGGKYKVRVMSESYDSVPRVKANGVAPGYL